MDMDYYTTTCGPTEYPAPEPYIVYTHVVYIYMDIHLMIINEIIRCIPGGRMDKTLNASLGDHVDARVNCQSRVEVNACYEPLQLIQGVNHQLLYFN